MNKISLKTGDMFHDLWKELTHDQFINSINLIKKRLKINNFKEKKFKNKIVLDIGCGSGRFCILANQLKAKKIIGIDSSKININYNKKKFKKFSNIKFEFGDNTNLPLKNNFSDITISNGVIHHTTDMYKSMSEIIRVTKKGGVILLLVYGDHGMRWSLIRKLQPICLIIGKNKMIKYMKKSKLLSNNVKNFVDDLFVPIKVQTNLDHLIEYLKDRTSKIKFWNKFKTLDHEENFDTYIEEMHKIKNFSNFIENKFLRKLSLKIINAYISEVNLINNSNLSNKDKRYLVIGEGNHRLEIIK